MRKVALVTYSKHPELFDGDNLLVEPFKKRGFTPISIPWDKMGVEWDSFDLVIIRSVWDYHTRIREFSDWINTLEISKVNIWNPAKIIRWNMDKKYLLELKSKGIPIVPTLIINKANVQNIGNLLKDRLWEEVIIKPTIGASSYKIIRVKSRELSLHSSEIEDILRESEMIIQPYIREINLEGECSFLFFNKVYSHAVLKKPKADEYRTQPEFGGSEVGVKPDPNVIKQASNILNKIDSSLLYARVDGLIVNGQFMLMELELIEPYLFFEFEKASAERFVEAAMNTSFDGN